MIALHFEGAIIYHANFNFSCLDSSQPQSPFLETCSRTWRPFSKSYPDQELASLAGDLRICIATLGAVWSAEMTNSAEKVGKKASKEGGSPRQLIEELAPVHEKKIEKSSQSGTQCNGHSVSGHKMEEVLETNDVVSSSYQQALGHIQTGLLPEVAHGLVQLANLVRARDGETLDHRDTVLTILTEHLNHLDSYVYLAAIKGLVAVGSVWPRYTLQHVCKIYAQFTKVEKLKKSSPSDKGLYRPAKEVCKAAGPSASVEVRVKLGEALVEICRECGDTLPQYCELLVAALMCNVMNSEEPLVRASSLSNLADVCVLMKYSFPMIQLEVRAIE